MTEHCDILPPETIEDLFRFQSFPRAYVNWWLKMRGVPETELIGFREESERVNYLVQNLPQIIAEIIEMRDFGKFRSWKLINDYWGFSHDTE